MSSAVSCGVGTGRQADGATTSAVPVTTCSSPRASHTSHVAIAVDDRTDATAGDDVVAVEHGSTERHRQPAHRLGPAHAMSMLAT